MEYLTEQSLGEYLKQIFPGKEFVHNKKLFKYKPDYYCEENKLVVEFDGFRHYNESKTILKDFEKNRFYQENKFWSVRIPYFVQLSKVVIENLFHTELDFIQKYPHGFIDKKALLPADFCELGIERFKADLLYFDYIKLDIINSLKIKMEEVGNRRLVVSNSLSKILNL